MENVILDRLMQKVVACSASELHITTDQPPVVRVGGHLIRLETKVLDDEDTKSLMKSITPERCQQELQECGGSDFGFAFGEAARFRVSIFKHQGNVAMVLRRAPKIEPTLAN